MATQAQIAAVQQLYIGYLGRAADKAGLDFWTNAVATGVSTLESVATGFTLSNEYKAAFGGLTNDALVEKVYTSVLGRASDTAGKAFWVDALAKGTVTADKLVATFIGALGAPDQTIINNKTFVAQTYTDTVGADFNKAAAAEVIANVDGTSASVTAALTAINSGTLEGQVPGVNQIEALAAAQAAVTVFEEANTAAADALVAKLAAHVDESDTDYINADSSYQDKVNAVVEDATEFRDLIGDATNILEGKAQLAATQVNNQYALLSKTDKALADTLVSAIAAETTAKTGVATPVEKATAIAGLGADPTAKDALVILAGQDADQKDIAEGVYNAYVAGVYGDTKDAEVVRSAIDDALKGSDTYAAFKASAVKDAAFADAKAATEEEMPKLPNSCDAYIAALVEKTTADATVADAKVADADVAAATELKDAYAVQTGALADAEKAVEAVNVAGKVAIHELTASTTGTGTDAAPIKDVFYFGDKAVAANDFSITKFAAGDSIVLGENSYTFNSGALSTGDNNTLEFFLVQGGKDLQIVLETANYGSADVKTNATTGAVTSSDHAAVITLTGVALADVTVNHGIVSHVA